MNPLVSVIMPVHNAGDYLLPAVNSILQQTYPHFELIIVDDHSTDNAIASLPVSDSRIKLTSTNKRGVVHAMQQGVTQSNGTYIARMDADDEALPQRLAVQLEFLENRPDIGIVASQVEIFSEQGIARGFRDYQQWLNSLVTPQQISQQLFIESPLPNPAVMFRRQVYEQLGGYHDSPWAEDYDCWLRADEQGIKMAKPPGILLRWRNHDARLTHNDVRYSQDNFMQAKAYYLGRSRLRDKQVIIWGSGPIGTRFCDLLQAHSVTVRGFIDVNPRRIGSSKRGLPVWSMQHVEKPHESMVIGAVGSRGARADIRNYLVARGYHEGVNLLFVA